MVEALVVLMLVVLGGGAYISALFLASAPMTEAELAGLKQCYTDLTERIEKGREQNWDAVMLCHLRQQRVELEARIAKTAVSQ